MPVSQAKNEKPAAPPMAPVEDLLPVVMLEVVDTNLDSIETPDLLNTEGVTTDLFMDTIPQPEVQNTPTFEVGGTFIFKIEDFVYKSL